MHGRGRHEQVSLAGRRWNIAWRIEDMPCGPLCSIVCGMPYFPYELHSFQMSESIMAACVICTQSHWETIRNLALNWRKCTWKGHFVVKLATKADNVQQIDQTSPKVSSTKGSAVNVHNVHNTVYYFAHGDCLPLALWKFFFFSVLDKQTVRHTSNCLRTHCSYNGKSSFTTFADAIASAFRENLSCWHIGQGAFANCGLHEHVVWHVAFVECTLKCYRFSPGQLVIFALLMGCCLSFASGGCK